MLRQLIIVFCVSTLPIVGYAQVSVDEAYSRLKAKQAERAGATTQAATQPQGATVFRIPIRGTIGTEVTADMVKEALDSARKAKADYVAIYFETPGGQITEMGRIIEVLGKAKDLRLIAQVHQAFSAGAIIALTCSHIY